MLLRPLSDQPPSPSAVCAPRSARTQPDRHVDVRRSHGLLCGVRRPADVPALPSVLPRRPAAQRSPQRGGRGQPSALAGPGQPQSAAGHALSGYGADLGRWPIEASSAVVFFFFLI